MWLLIALILFFLWLSGAFIANVGSIIHLLLVLAILVAFYDIVVAPRRGPRV